MSKHNRNDHCDVCNCLQKIINLSTFWYFFFIVNLFLAVVRTMHPQLVIIYVRMLLNSTLEIFVGRCLCKTVDFMAAYGQFPVHTLSLFVTCSQIVGRMALTQPVAVQAQLIEIVIDLIISNIYLCELFVIVVISKRQQDSRQKVNIDYYSII